jgi:hypothetical protein
MRLSVPVSVLVTLCAAVLVSCSGKSEADQAKADACDG